MWQANTGLFAQIEDSSRVAGDSADSQTLVVDLVPCALAANATHWVESGDAAADSVIEYLVDSTSDDAEAG